MGRYEEAVACHLAATKCEGETEEAWYNIGLIRGAQLRLHEAKEAFENALLICPDYPDAQKHLEDVEEAMQLQSRLRTLGLAD